MLTHYQTKHRPNVFNTLPSEQLARAGAAARRADKIEKIVKLSNPPNPAVFQRHLEGWNEDRLDLRLKTLNDQAVHQVRSPREVCNIADALRPFGTPHSY